MNDGGPNKLKCDRKVIWVYPIDNVNRSTVRLVDKYISLLPPLDPKTKKSNFYLNPAQWYGEQAVGCHTLAKTMSYSKTPNYMGIS